MFFYAGFVSLDFGRVKFWCFAPRSTLTLVIDIKSLPMLSLFSKILPFSISLFFCLFPLQLVLFFFITVTVRVFSVPIIFPCTLSYSDITRRRARLWIWLWILRILGPRSSILLCPEVRFSGICLSAST